MQTNKISNRKIIFRVLSYKKKYKHECKNDFKKVQNNIIGNHIYLSITKKLFDIFRVYCTMLFELL